ncbi:MAG: HAD family hydrolase [Lachnospiraceae bacterium]
MKKAVIFDMDGTLLNTLEDLCLSTNAALGRYGFPARTLEEVRQFVGNGAVNLMRRAVPAGEDNPHFEDCLRAFREHYGEHLNDHTGPYEGILELLRRFSERDVPMAIVSNKPDFAVRELNEKYFGGRIRVAIGESEQVRRKPAPDTVKQAARELKVRLEDCIYVGDSEVDLQTAKNCGIPCVSVTWGFRSRELLLSLGAEHTAADARELQEVLLGLLNQNS